MGLLGLEQTKFITDRIFDIIDIDGKGYVTLFIITFYNNYLYKQVKFKEFLKYLDILMHGQQDKKAEISFKLIDVGR